MLSGYHKLFNAPRHRTFVDELKALGVPAVAFNQWWVPTVEFTAGGGVLIGLLAYCHALVITRISRLSGLAPNQLQRLMISLQVATDRVHFGNAAGQLIRKALAGCVTAGHVTADVQCGAQSRGATDVLHVHALR
jgi:hypothetical protein